QLASNEELFQDSEKQKALKRLTTTPIKIGVAVHEIWANLLKQRNEKLQPNLCKWVLEWSRRGELQQKQQWEQFIAEYVPPTTTQTRTTTLSAEIVVGGQSTKPKSIRW